MNDTVSLVGNLLLIATISLSTAAHAERFTIAVIPDTQFYSESNPAVFRTQTQWIVDNRATDNIVYVAHLGDLVDSRGCQAEQSEWGAADDAMRLLDAAGIPYGVLPGNHDNDPTTPPSFDCAVSRNNYNTGLGSARGFGPTRYSAVFYGGSQDGGATNDNNYIFFSSPGGVDFIAINLAYAAAVGPEEREVIDWADQLLADNPNRYGIVASHFMLTDSRVGDGVDDTECEGADDLGAYGRAVWDALKDNPNLSLLLGGHCSGEKQITMQGAPERSGLNEAHLLLSNYQDRSHGQIGRDSGYMRLMRFDTTEGTIAVETFSPWIASGVPGRLPASGTPPLASADKFACPVPPAPIAMSTTSVSNFCLTYRAVPAVGNVPRPPVNLRIQ